MVGYTPSEDDVRAVIKLGDQARWVADYYPVEVLEDVPDGLVVRFSASDPSVIGRLLVRLGPHAELIEGEAVAHSTAELRRTILARYADA
jgi:proteasome accessory factor C